MQRVSKVVNSCFYEGLKIDSAPLAVVCSCIGGLGTMLCTVEKGKPMRWQILILFFALAVFTACSSDKNPPGAGSEGQRPTANEDSQEGSGGADVVTRYESVEQASEDFFRENRFCTLANLETAKELREDTSDQLETDQEENPSLIIKYKKILDNLDEYIGRCEKVATKLETQKGTNELVKLAVGNPVCSAVNAQKTKYFFKHARQLYDRQIEEGNASQQRSRNEYFTDTTSSIQTYYLNCGYSLSDLEIPAQAYANYVQYDQKARAFFRTEFVCDASRLSEAKTLQQQGQDQFARDSDAIESAADKVVVEDFYKETKERLKNFIEACAASIDNQREMELNRNLSDWTLRIDQFFQSAPQCSADKRSEAKGLKEELQKAALNDQNTTRSVENLRRRLNAYQALEGRVDGFETSCVEEAQRKEELERRRREAEERRRQEEEERRQEEERKRVEAEKQRQEKERLERERKQEEERRRREEAEKRKRKYIPLPERKPEIPKEPEPEQPDRFAYYYSKAGADIYQWAQVTDPATKKSVRALQVVASLPAGIRIQVNLSKGLTNPIIQKDGKLFEFQQPVYGGIYILDSPSKTQLSHETQARLNKERIFMLSNFLSENEEEVAPSRTIKMRLNAKRAGMYHFKWFRTNNKDSVRALVQQGSLGRGSELLVYLTDIRPMANLKGSDGKIYKTGRTFIKAKVLSVEGRDKGKVSPGEKLYVNLKRLDTARIVSSIYNRKLPDGAPEYPRFKWSSHNPSGTWAHAIVQGLNESSNRHLVHSPPSDIRRFCPKYLRLPNRKRELFWVYLMAEIADIESGFNPFTAFDEGQIDADMKGVISSGLMQISYKSTRGGCRENRGCDRIEKQKDFYYPEKNLRCALGVMSCLADAYNCIACKSSSGSWRGVAAYWSSMKTRFRVRCKTCSKGYTYIGYQSKIKRNLRREASFCF